MHPLHNLFMQQTFIIECLLMGNPMRSKQIGHRSPSGLSWPLAVHRRSEFRAADSAESAAATFAILLPRLIDASVFLKDRRRRRFFVPPAPGDTSLIIHQPRVHAQNQPKVS